MRALAKIGNPNITEEARKYLIGMANGEARSLINMLEAIGFALQEGETLTIELAQTVSKTPD